MQRAWPWGLLVAVMLAGCAGSSDPMPETPEQTSSSTTSGQPAPPDAPRLHQIDIQSFAFNPSSLTIAVGDSVEWTNLDGSTHTVDSTDGGPLDSGNLAKGDTFVFTFEAAGTFAYRCDIHPSMTGTITVA